LREWTKWGEFLFTEISEKALEVSIARASVEEIDTINILQASLLAMRRAVDGLSNKPGHVLVDGNRLPDWDYSSEAIIQGDGSVEQISAASIIAKVTRDREMVALEEKYPGYGFAAHKGYPTKQHLEALRIQGISDIHRRSFGPVKQLLLQTELF